MHRMKIHSPTGMNPVQEDHDVHQSMSSDPKDLKTNLNAAGKKDWWFIKPSWRMESHLSLLRSDPNLRILCSLEVLLETIETAAPPVAWPYLIWVSQSCWLPGWHILFSFHMLTSRPHCLTQHTRTRTQTQKQTHTDTLTQYDAEALANTHNCCESATRLRNMHFG